MGNLEAKKLFIFDLDGTVYIGGKAFDFAVRFIDRLRRSGRRVLFFTNNASHSSQFYFTKLSALGFEPRREEIMTAGDVTAEFIIRHRPGASVYLLGTGELRRDWRARGIRLLTDDNITDGERADIVVSSFDTELTYERLTHAARLIRLGAEYICTHPDRVCPTEDGFIPDSGAIAAALTAATGVVPRFFGKPGAETVDMILEVTRLMPDECCVFGDRLYTDIALGKKSGILSCLVLTGETTKEDVLTADPECRPDLIFPSLAEADAAVFGQS